MASLNVEVYDAFREAGVSDKQAKAAAATVPTARDAATKQDVVEVRRDLTGQIVEVRRDLTGRIDDVRRDLTGRIDEVRRELLGRIEKESSDTRERFSRLEAQISKSQSEMYRAIWMQAGAVVTIVVSLLKLFP